MSIQRLIFDKQKENRVFEAIYDEEARAWFCAYHLFDDGHCSISVTTSNASLFAACRIVEKALFRVESDFASGQLVLPDMGDWQVEYHDK